ncbi:MAG TPA: carboxypeptidase-like regulatory domain-containing protein [Myxococcaceae bacterium]|jgi:hypothetical protein
MFWNRSGVCAPALCVVLCGCNLVVQTISEYGGEPIPGVQLQVDDQPWVVTNAEGRASFTPPGGRYTLRVLQPTDATSASGRRYVTWDLLEIDGPPGNPVVLQVEGTFVPHRQVSLSGTAGAVTDGEIILWLEGGGVVSGGTATTLVDGTYEMEAVQWEGGDGRKATLHALQRNGAAFPATHYLAYGSAPVTLRDLAGTGGRIEGVDMLLRPIEEAAVHGELAVPPALAGQAYASLSVKLAEGWTVVGLGPVAGSFDVSVPQIPGAGGTSMSAWAVGSAQLDSEYGGQLRSVSPGASVAFDLPAPVELLEPADGTAIGADTVFRWSPHPSRGAYDLHVQCHWTQNGEEHDVNYRELETELTERSLPVFPGVEIPSGTSCTWDVAWREVGTGSFSVAVLDRQSRSSVSRVRTATFR